VSVHTWQTLAAGASAGESARLQAGAYITDGTHLHEVRRVRITGTNFVRVTLEDSKTFATQEVTVAEIRKRFRLVRAADRLPVRDPE
jgi:hypothetical protein